MRKNKWNRPSKTEKIQKQNQRIKKRQLKQVHYVDLKTLVSYMNTHDILEDVEDYLDTLFKTYRNHNIVLQPLVVDQSKFDYLNPWLALLRFNDHRKRSIESIQRIAFFLSRIQGTLDYIGVRYSKYFWTYREKNGSIHHVYDFSFMDILMHSKKEYLIRWYLSILWFEADDDIQYLDTDNINLVEFIETKCAARKPLIDKCLYQWTCIVGLHSLVYMFLGRIVF